MKVFALQLTITWSLQSHNKKSFIKHLNMNQCNKKNLFYGMY